MSRVISFSDSGASSPPPAHPPAAASNLQAGKTARPLKRAAPRFLGDNDSDDVIASKLAKKKTSPADIEKLFADLDGDSDDGDMRLPPPLKSRNNATQDSIIDDTITAFGRSKKKGKNGENGDGELDDKIDGQEGEKKRKAPRKRAMMNEERLLGDRGFRKLRDNLKTFKIKGKGHEEEDLRKLMTVYQLWAHQMFPVGDFRDTIETVEKLCHKKGVKYELTVWRDEAKGIFRPKAGESSEADLDMEGAEGARNGENNEDGEENRPPTTSQPASPDPNRPKKSYFDNIPTSSPGGGLGGDAEMGDGLFDSDDEEGQRRGRGRSSTAGGDVFGNRPPTSEAGFDEADLLDLDNEAEEEDFDMEAEAEAAMREMEMMEDAQAGPSVPNKPNPQAGTSAGASKVHRPINFYANAVADPKKAGVASAAEKEASKVDEPLATTASADDNFDDFDFGDEEDIMREMEMEEQRQATSRPTSTADLSKTPSLSTGTDDFDFDDLEEDEEFLKGMQEAGEKNTEETGNAMVSKSPVKAQKAVPSAPVIEEEEDLYS